MRRTRRTIEEHAMNIPPHAARLAGTWAVSSTRPAAEPVAAPPRRRARDRSSRTAIARVLHPLSRPIPLSRNDSQSPAGTQPARHA
ncbi:hypothetical protein GCM10009858_26010 [Terrabacter carboxydivorans]|uniref:Uncharacterized protein n=1 Tax=Terrabacter carboxydivorans TaxID=619730 RepID=A0ABN3LPS4_9MICO